MMTDDDDDDEGKDKDLSISSFVFSSLEFMIGKLLAWNRFVDVVDTVNKLESCCPLFKTFLVFLSFILCCCLRRCRLRRR